MSKNFDVVVIGGGPGGYIAAIRAAQLGLNTACIDEWKSASRRPGTGGTCTNVGCIPSKALLQSSENFEHAGHGFAEHGIGLKACASTWRRCWRARTWWSSRTMTASCICSRRTRSVSSMAAAPSLRPTKKAMRSLSKATRPTSCAPSMSSSPPDPMRAPCLGADFDEAAHPVQRRRAAHGRRAEDLGRHRLGRDRPGDGFGVAPPGGPGHRARGAAHLLWVRWTSRSPRKRTSSSPSKACRSTSAPRSTRSSVGNKTVAVHYTDATGAEHKLEVERLIVSIGRVPNTTGLNADGVGLKLDERGFVVVDDECRSNLPNVWAVGDVVRGPMLAHKAEEEGVAVAERIAGQHGHVNYNDVPWVIYTSPEIAWVGATEQQLEAEGSAYRAGTFPFMANGRARAHGRHHRHGEDAGRRRHRRGAGRTHHRTDGQRADRRSRDGDGVQGQLGRHRAHLPCPPQS